MIEFILVTVPTHKPRFDFVHLQVSIHSFSPETLWVAGDAMFKCSFTTEWESNMCRINALSGSVNGWAGGRGEGADL